MHDKFTTEYRREKTEVRGRRSEVGRQRSEGRGRKTEVRRQEKVGGLATPTLVYLIESASTLQTNSISSVFMLA